MSFVQIIEFRTDDFDKLKAYGDEWEEKSAGRSTARRRIMCRDRDDPERYVNIVFFDSYESAMENSEDPVTQEMSQKMAALVQGAPVFHNLDVVEDRD